MSLKEQDRKSLVVLGLEKSDKMIDEMKFLVETNNWSLAANRLYYALFHAVRALLISETHPVGTHRGAVIQFNLYYIKTGIFNKSDGKLYSHLQQLRDEGDYNCVIDVEQEDVEDKIEPTLSLITRIKQYIANHSN
jgi:uncharacterized protein (UPF0332 family)